eukprot:gene15234-19442_t
MTRALAAALIPLSVAGRRAAPAACGLGGCAYAADSGIYREHGSAAPLLRAQDPPSRPRVGQTECNTLRGRDPWWLRRARAGPQCRGGHGHVEGGGGRPSRGARRWSTYGSALQQAVVPAAALRLLDDVLSFAHVAGVAHYQNWSALEPAPG